jgi:hypothetical protein
MSFGGFVAGSGGTVSVSAAGVRTATGGVALLTLARLGTPRAATFSVTAAGAQNTFTIALPASATLSRAGGGTMTVDTFTSPASGSQVNGKGNGSLAGNPGTGTFSLGARLTVGANQLAGAYTGSFSVTITYP